jgi:hypothetical protein
MPRFATTDIALWQTNLKLQQFATTGIIPWLSALKFTLLTVAIRGTIIFLVAIRDKIIVFIAILSTHLSAVCNNIVKSCTNQFTSTIPLFPAPHILYAQLYKCKTNTRRIF